LGIPLKIFGVGPAYNKLKKMARPNIEFLGRISEEEKAKLFSEAIAFINPQVEDFGIVMIEAMVFGRPVIAYKKGGAEEIVIPNKTGVFFNDQNWEALADTIIHFRPENFNSEEIKSYARQFDTTIFKNKIKEYIDSSWREFQNNL